MIGRRQLVAGALVTAALATGVVWTSTGGEPEPPDVVATFDDAAYLVAGQDVRIAGAPAGRVRAVRLSPGRKALVSMDIDEAYLPLRSDGRCTIRPQSLIGERYVDCSPGTAAGRPLARDGKGSQLLPVQRTSAPVDLDLVLDTLDRPVSERLALIIVELGGSLSGRAGDLAQAIHRAAPALQDANRLLALLDRDRDRIGRLVDATDTIIDGVADRRAAVPRFIRRARAVTRVTARRRAQLRDTVRRLPALLRSSRGALTELRGTAEDGLPVATDLRRSAGAVNALVGAIPALAEAGTPALAAVGSAARTLRPAARALRPVAAAARPFARLAVPTGTTLDELARSLREKGATRGLLTFLMNATLATSRYDSVSHVLTATQMQGVCSMYATTPTRECSAHFAAGRPQALRATRKREAARPQRPRATPGRDSRPALPKAPQLPSVPDVRVPEIRLPGVPPIRLPGLGDVLGGRDSADPLLEYLLG